MTKKSATSAATTTSPAPTTAATTTPSPPTTTSTTPTPTTPTTPNAYSTSEIGASFIHSYYGTLTQKPQKLSLLYKRASQVTHCFDGADVKHYTGDAISGALAEFTNGIAKNVKVKLHMVECQSSLASSVLVLVNGSLFNAQHVEIVHFSQSFILAPQKNGYYVCNDILRITELKRSLSSHVLSAESLSAASSSTRDSAEEDSTVATLGEGSVVSAGQLDQEDVLSSDSALNGDSMSETKSISSDKEDLVAAETAPAKSSTTAAAAYTDKKKPSRRPTKKTNKATTPESAPVTTTTAAAQESSTKQQQKEQTATPATPSTEQAPAEPKHQKKPRRTREDKKAAQSAPAQEQEQKPKEEEKPAVPSTYASIVGREANNAQPATEQKKKFKKEKKETTKEAKPAATAAVAAVAADQKTETKPETGKSKKTDFFKKERSDSATSTPATPNADGEKPFEKRKKGPRGIKPDGEFKPKFAMSSEDKFGLYVARVDPSTTDQDLKDAFSKYGEIVDMNNGAKANEKKQGFIKLGYALIFFKTQQAVQQAVKDKEIPVAGHTVSVSEHSRREKPEKPIGGRPKRTFKPDNTAANSAEPASESKDNNQL